MKKKFDIPEDSSGMAKTKIIFGEQRVFSSVTIIPVAKIRYIKKNRYPGNSDDDKNFIKRISPVGYIEIRDDETNFIPIYDYKELFVLGASCSLGLCILIDFIKRAFCENNRESELRCTLKNQKKSNNCSFPLFLSISLGIVAGGFIAAKYLIPYETSHSFDKTIDKETHNSYTDKRQSDSISEPARKNVTKIKQAKTNNPEVLELWETPEITIIEESPNKPDKLDS